MTETALVTIKNLTFTYERGPQALSDVSLEVPQGEVLAVLGANGAGKTTLCYHINGIIPEVYGGTEKGEVMVAGLDPWETPIIQLAQNVSMVLQDPESQFITNDVRSELAFGPANLGVPRDEILKRMEYATDVCGLQGLWERAPTDLSGGQKQRVAFGAGLTMLPKVLVLDEPTSQLDPIGTTEVLEALHRLTQDDKMTIIISTHKTEKAAEFASNAIVLEKGKIVTSGTPKEVFAQTELLGSVGVNPPQVTLLCSRLAKKIPGFREKYEKQDGIPIKLDECYSFLKELLDDGFIRIETKDFQTTEVQSDEPVLEVKDLVYVYPGRNPVTALKGINLTVNKGEIVALIGQNGSGKTTLVKHFVGLLKPTQGEVIALGKDVATMTTGALARTISLILQNPDYQLFSMSAEKEIEFGLTNLGLPKDEIKKRVDAALEEAGLIDERDIFPFRLSFGDRRNLAAAAGIAMDPSILILDEPTTAQDYRGRHRLAKIALRMQQQGRTSLVISHDMELIATYCSRTIVLRNGEKILDAPTREVFSQQDVLKQSNIEPPQITQLGEMLKDYGINQIPLSVEEMVSLIEAGE